MFRSNPEENLREGFDSPATTNVSHARRQNVFPFFPKGQRSPD